MRKLNRETHIRRSILAGLTKTVISEGYDTFAKAISAGPT